MDSNQKESKVDPQHGRDYSPSMNSIAYHHNQT